MRNILIIKLGAIGDVLRTTCILLGLQEKYPKAHIVWITSSDAMCLINNNPLVHTVVDIRLFPTSHLHNTIFDLVINLDDDLLACNIATQVQKKQLFGAYTSDGKRKYTMDSSKWFDMSLISVFGKDEADRRKRNNRCTYPSLLFDMLDIPIGRPLLTIPKQDLAFACRFAQIHISGKKPIIGINTGAGPRWRFKQLGESKTIELIDRLKKTFNCDVFLFGGSAEAIRNQSIRSVSPHKIIDTGNENSLLEFAALINLCDLLITSDSLALHIASSLEIPSIVFFGPTSANEIELFTQGAKIVPDMDCVCCYKQDCDFSPTCMDNISLNNIIRRTSELLDNIVVS